MKYVTTTPSIQVPYASFYCSHEVSGKKIKFYVLCGNPLGSFKKTTQPVIKPNYANRCGGTTVDFPSKYDPGPEVGRGFFESILICFPSHLKFVWDFLLNMTQVQKSLGFREGGKSQVFVQLKKVVYSV